MIRARVLVVGALVGLIVPIASVPAQAVPAQAAAGAVSAKQQAAPLLFDPGVEVRLGSSMKRLKRTPPAFRQAVRRELLALWRASGKKPACRRAPLITVHEVRASGFAFVDEGVYGPSKCLPGGFFRFFVKVGKKWRAPRALGGQEQFRCGVLTSFHVPRMTGAKGCYSDDGAALVNYFPNGVPTIDWNRDAAQAGETFCGTFQQPAFQGTRPQQVYASGVDCGSAGVLTDWWDGGDSQVGWTCDGFQNGLLGCSLGDTSTIALTVASPYLRAVRPGGLSNPTT